MRRFSSRFLTIGVGVTAIVGATAMVAAACVEYRGTLKLKNTTADRGVEEAEVVGSNNEARMEWCDDTEPVDPVDAQPGDEIQVTVFPSGECSPAGNHTGSSLDTAGLTNDNQAAPGFYVVTFFPGTAYRDDGSTDNTRGKVINTNAIADDGKYHDSERTKDCMVQQKQKNPEIEILSVFVVGIGGQGSATVTVPANAPANTSENGHETASAICTSRLQPGKTKGTTNDTLDRPPGNQIPVRIQ